MRKLLIAALIAASFFATTADAKTERSQSAKNEFRAAHPCPANGNRQGPCPGYIIDHITPLACGGADAPSNMQWQTEADAKEKDLWEREGCEVGATGSSRGHAKTARRSAGREYITGPRGGCYYLTASGRKQYVSHGKCGFE